VYRFLIAAMCLVSISVSGLEAQVLDTKPSDNLPSVLLPMTPVIEEPVVDELPPKPPVPTTIAEVIHKLPADTWYLIETKVPYLILDSPEGFVAIKEYDVSTISRSFLGRMADGNGNPDEERVCPTNAAYKYVYSVRAIKPGNIELLIAPVGVTSKQDVTRQKLTVMGNAPQPPPTPIDPVDPPVPVPRPTGLRVLILYEETANRDQLNAVNSLELYKFMNENCAKDPNGSAGWRKWDRSSVNNTGVENETELWKKLWVAIKPQATQLNMVFVITDTKIQSIPLTNLTTTINFIQQVKDGK